MISSLSPSLSEDQAVSVLDHAVEAQSITAEQREALLSEYHAAVAARNATAGPASRTAAPPVKPAEPILSRHEVLRQVKAGLLTDDQADELLNKAASPNGTFSCKLLADLVIPARTFSTGSRGYWGQGKITALDGRRYQVQVQVWRLARSPRLSPPAPSVSGLIRPGRTYIDEVYRYPDEARRRAEQLNEFATVPGVCYIVLPHRDDEPLPMDYFEPKRAPRYERAAIVD